MSDNSQHGNLIIISGPSGAGKSSVVSRLIDECPLPLKMSVSATTRPPRAKEVEGQSYIFLTVEQFKDRIEQGAFLEYAEVFGIGHYYGSLKDQVTTGLEQGNWIVLEVDVEGAQQAKQIYPSAISIFIHPGSLDELERRLRGRGTEDDEVIARRLEVASHEMEAAVLYDHVVVNQTIDTTVNEICQLLIQSSDSKIEKT